MNTSDKISIGALFVSIITLWILYNGIRRTSDFNDDLKETNYKLASVEYRPRIRFFNPQVSQIDIKVDSIPPKLNTNIQDSIIGVNATISLQLKVYYTNIGNSTAKMLDIFIADTISNEQVIKDAIQFLEKNNTDSLNLSSTPDPNIELTLIDTLHIDIEHKIQFISNNSFTIHILAFYKNDIEQVFDTYYWIYYKTNDIVIPNPSYSRKKYLDFINKNGKEFLRIIEYKDENNYSSAYSKEESSKFIEMYAK